MAGNNYKLLIQADIDAKAALAKVKADALKEKIQLNVKIDLGDTGKAISGIDTINQRFQEIKNTTDKLATMSAKKNPLGIIDQYTLNYMDELKNKYTEVYRLISKPVTKTITDQTTGKETKITEMVSEWQKVEKVVDGVAARQKELDRTQKEHNKALEQTAKLRAKELDEMEKAAKQADLFLAKSKNLASTPSVQAAIGKANELKVAVSDGDISKVRRLKDELDLAKAALQTGRTGLDSWSEGLRNSIKQTVEYATSIGLVYGALSQIREGIQYLKDLDKELTNVQIVTGKSDSQIAELSLEYNRLAKELGSTTLEISKGSLEWFRQGKTVEETGELMKSTMMMAKLGNMESAQSTEYLTSIINGFKLEAEDTQDVVSKLISLDNAFATSTAEIASAMQRSSVSAQQAGVSMEELASMITVVSDVSRRAPESIGESFKTMFARYQDILAGQVDEDGMGINNVGKALERVGINIRDVEGGFRDFGEVLEELYPKWTTLSEVEQANITKALAGVRQRESLLVLLENQTKYSKALEVQMDSEGLAAERYSVYLDSVEASQNKLRASWESLVSGSASSDMIKLFYNASSGVLEFINAIGGLPVVLIAAGAAYLAFSTTVVGGTTVALLSITSLQAAWTALLATNPMGWAVLAVAALVAIANAIPTAEERLQKLNEEIDSSNQKISSLRDTAKTISDLSSEYEKLSGITNKTSEESERFVNVQNQLKEIVPELSGHFDEYGNFILDASNDMKALNERTLEQIALEKELRQAKIDEKAEAEAQNLLGLQRRKISTLAKGGSLYSESEKIQINLDWSKALEDSKSAFNEMSEEGKKAFISSLMESGVRGKELASIFVQEMNNEVAEQENLLFGKPEQIQEQAEKSSQLAYESFTATLESLIADDDIIKSLFEKSMIEGLDFSDISKVPEAYLDALSVENGQLKLNIDLIKEKQVAEAEMSLNAIKQAYERGEATAQEVSIIQLYYDNLLESQYRVVDGTQVTQGAFNELAWSIAQNASMSGNSFVDMQGKALNSVESIYKYLTSGDAAFNDFVRQAANITGMSVEEVMNQINGMLQTTANNAAAIINYLGASSLGVDSGFNRAPSPPKLSSGLFTPAPSGYQYPGGLSDYSKSSGGSGGISSQNSQLEKQNKLEKQIQETEEQIEKARKNAIDSLKDQLDVYKDIVDARKDIIDSLADERKYQQDVEDKSKEILKVQNELATLQLDTSDFASARRLQLQDELSNLTRDLENIHYEQSAELQKKALDEEYKSLEQSIAGAIRQIEGIQAGSLSEFASQLSSVLSNLSINVPQFHDGAKSGVVGKGMSLKNNEIFAKLMTGEVVSTSGQIDNFMKKTLPQIAEGSSSFTGGNIELSMPINVAGTLDKSVIPDLDKFAEKLLVRLQQMMNQRGWNRRADLFQT